MTNIPRHIFRAYDIRGIVPDEINEDVISHIAAVIATKCRQLGETSIITARDGRLSSPGLHAALNQALLLNGVDVIDIGLSATPILYYATCELGVTNGIMLTASHNPSHYNGLKMVIQGRALSDDAISELHDAPIHSDEREGVYKQVSLNDAYIEHINRTFSLKHSYRVVVDCGNSVAGLIAPKLIAGLGCAVIPLYCDVDGTFPNHQPDPSDESNLAVLKQVVKEEDADFGLAFDGDGDRIALVTPNAGAVPADYLMMLFAEDVLNNHPRANIIFDVKCSKCLADWIGEKGGTPIMSQTGHSLIKAAMLRENALLAGEMSGHIFFKDGWYGFDDAFYAAARLLSIIDKKAVTIDDLVGQLPQAVYSPEIKIAIEEQDKFRFVSAFKQQAEFPGAERITIDGLRVEWQDAWGLLRASNTSAYLITRYEGTNIERMQQVKSLFEEQIDIVARNLGIAVAI